MIKNYFILTVRNFIRNRSYTLINVLGLSIGITSCIILFLLIRYELSFDNFHTKADGIFRVVHDQENASGTDYVEITPYPFAAAFRNDFPEIPLMTQFHDEGETLVAMGAEKQMVKDVLFADSLFFEVFDFKVLSGNPLKDLGEPGKVFLTKSLAEKLLKGEQKGTLKLANLAEVEVAGIIEDARPNSDIQFSMIVSMSTLTKDFINFELDQWGLNSSGYSYIVLPETISKTKIEDQFKPFVLKYYDAEDETQQTYKLQSLSEIHFDGRYSGKSVSASVLIVLGLLGVFILALACINFINLATALAIKKSKEIGVRKTLGARRSQLTFYFLGETLIITLFSLLLSLGLVEWILPWLNGFLDKSLSQSLFTDGLLILFLFLLTTFVTVCSGLYPAFILSGFNPAAVLKNKISTQGNSGAYVRKVLVAFQFLIAQALIIGTLIVADQIDHFRKSPMGFNKDAIVNVDMPDNKVELHESFRSRLASNPDILDVSFSIGAPVSFSGFGTNFRLAEEDKEQLYDVSIKTVDHHYLKTYGLQLIAGRWITENEEKLASPPILWDDRKYVFVVNESAVKKLGFHNPEDILDKQITVGIDNTTGPVVGVVKDFHVTSLHKAIDPVALMNFSPFYYNAGLRINTSNMEKTLSFIEDTWKNLHPDYYYKYEFLDDHIANLYRQEERTFTLFKVFSGVSIFIGCLGLYGLISFMANQKLKEVGIRKVMGASVTSIVVLFSREFIKLIILAFVVAAPLTWYGMNQWLDGFAYHIDIHWSVFAVGIAATLIIALLTVGYRSVQAALSNPVDTLRSE